MRLITAIEKNQYKDNQRYIISTSDGYTFSCNEELVVKLKLKEGKSLDDEDLVNIIKENNRKEAFNRALNYLAFRSRTKQEIINYLSQKGFDDDATNNTIYRLQSYQFINDKEYTLNFVQNQSQRQLKGKRVIRQKLINKGVKEEVIKLGLDTYSNEEELVNAIKIAKQYFFSNKSLPLNQIKQKLSNKLVGKGYSWDIISQCIQTLEMDLEIQELMESQRDLHIQGAKKIAEKYYQKHAKKEKNPHLLNRKVAAYLYRKGYQQELIYKIIDEL